MTNQDANIIDLQDKAIFDSAPMIYEVCRKLLLANRKYMTEAAYDDVLDNMMKMLCRLPSEAYAYKGNAKEVLDFASEAAQGLWHAGARLTYSYKQVNNINYISSAQIEIRTWADVWAKRFES